MSESVTFVIRPAKKRSLLSEVLELLRYRGLLFTMAQRDIQIRYKQAVVGILWVVMQPVLASAIFTFVFSFLAKVPSQDVPYPVFVFSGLLIWQYFARGVTEGSGSLVANAGIITKIYFPRSLIPLIVTFVAAADFLLAFGVMVAMMLILGVAIPWTIIFVPFILLIAATLAYGIALWLAPLNAIYRDIGIALPFLMQILMYLTPVIYPLSLVPQKWQFLFEFNPVATIIGSMRWAVLGHEPPSMLAYGVLFGLTFFIYWAGVRIFRRLEPTLVDQI